MIPDEAVEAAAREIYRVAAAFAYETDSWDDLSEGQREAFVDDARKILEAAAPYLMAKAWDECEAAKYEIRLNPATNAWEPVKDNPYRSQA